MLTTELIERVAAELAEAEATVDMADAQAKQLGSGKKKLEPFYAYSGCSRCLDLAGEIGKLLGSYLLDRLKCFVFRPYIYELEIMCFVVEQIRRGARCGRSSYFCKLYKQVATLRPNWRPH